VPTPSRTLCRRARVAGAVEGEGESVEGPGDVAAPIDRLTPQPNGLLQPSGVFEIGGEVVGHPPQGLGSCLLPRGLQRRFGD
jgi:hypothetical protein